MKTILFIFAAAQIIYTSGTPCGDFSDPESQRAINATIRKVNEEFATSNLFVIVKCEVTSRLNFGERIFQVNLTIEIQETVCNKSSGADPTNCTLIPVPEAREGH
ncbi:secreted phosphoprotein 24-like isoform X3 [Mustelus asterias]